MDNFNLKKYLAENKLNEGKLVKLINPSGEFKDAVVALENYLDTTGGTFDYNELAYLIIDIKDAVLNSDY